MIFDIYYHVYLNVHFLFLFKIHIYYAVKLYKLVFVVNLKYKILFYNS